MTVMMVMQYNHKQTGSAPVFWGPVVREGKAFKWAEITLEVLKMGAFLWTYKISAQLKIMLDETVDELQPRRNGWNIKIFM